MEAQRALIVEYGPHRICEIGAEANPANVYEFIRRLRQNDVVLLASADRLTDNRKELRLILDQLHEKGAQAIDLSTGHYSTSYAFALDAIAGISNDRYHLSHAEAIRRGTKGGRPAKIAPMAKDEAMDIWLNARFTTKEAATKIGISTAAGYRWLGSRNMPAGRPRHPVRLHELVPPQMKVYFVRNGNDGAVKIGTTADINGRLSALAHPLMKTLTLIGTLDGGYGLEKELHRRFAKYRIKGEWFKVEGALERFMETEFQPKRKGAKR